jgi:GNAT superfamily N-acetyltransferase
LALIEETAGGELPASGRPLRVVGGVHAMRPAPQEGVYQLYYPRHHIAWLMVAESWRGQGLGSRLLRAAENWLYYCPVFLASDSTPLYGTVEGPRPPLCGASQRMGISLREDRPMIEWLSKRGYGIVEAGDVSLGRSLEPEPPAPPEPDRVSLGLRVVAIDNQHPWQGAGCDELRLWADQKDHGHWPYQGVVLVDRAGTAVGRIVWYPQRHLGGAPKPGYGDDKAAKGVPDAPGGSAAIVRWGVAEAWRGRGLGGYLLDRTLHELGKRGYRQVEVQTHLQKHALAFEMYQRRRFQPEEAWANLVKQ